MGNNMVEIGNSAFMGCSSLQSFIVPDGISTLPLATFRECTNLESITLPASISQIKSFVFYLCDKLKDVYCWATTPPSITDSSFSTYGTLHVPAGCKAAYESDEYWKNFTIVENVATHVQQVSAETSTTPRKVMKDGTVSIKVNGQEYDMTGKTRK